MKPSDIGATKSVTHRLSGLRRLNLQHYVLPILSVGLAIGASVLLQHFHFRDPAAPLLLFAVAISSWYGGPGPAGLAVILSTIGFYWYFVEPVRTIYIYPSEIPYFIIFAAFAALISWFGTIRRRAEAVLREQANLLDLTHDTIFVMDLAGVIKYWNRGAEERYGWTAEQAVGRDVHDLLKTVFPAPLEQIKAAVTRTGRWEGELVHTRKDGSQVVVASRWSLQRGERGAPVAILETNNDITEHKRAEEALGRLNRELRAISNCNQTLLRATDEQSLLDEICRIVCEEAGYRMAWVANAEHDAAKSVRPVAWSGAEEGYLADLGISWADTERGWSPTGTAIRSGKTCCIQDFATDPRLAPWRESALQRGFRSGIGLPLKDEQANAFGSLSIYSAQPNAFTSEETRLLEELAADLAFGIVTLRSRAARQRAEESLRESETNLKRAQEIAHIGSWHRDFARNRLTWSDEVFRIFGVPLDTALSYEAFLEMVHPGDRESVHNAWSAALHGAPYDIEHRIVVGGDLKWVRERAQVEFSKEGDPRSGTGTVQDITERKRAEEKVRQQEMELRQVLDFTPQLVAVFGHDRKRLYANRPTLDYFGVTLEEWQSISDRFWFYHADDRERMVRDVYTGLASDGPHEFEARLRRKDGAYRWFLFRDNSLHDERGRIMRWYVTATDIEDRKQAEAERQARVWFLESMDRINRAIGGTNDLEQMTSDVINAMLSIFDSDRAFLYYPCDPDAPSFEVFMERTRPEYPGASGVIPMTPETARGFQIVRASSGVVTFGPGCDYPLIGDFAQRFGHQSSIGIALYPKTGQPWVLAMQQCAYPRVWTAEERKLLDEIARRLTDSLTSLLVFRSLRESEEALRRSETYLASAQRLTSTGSWALDGTTRMSLYWSDETFRIWGFDPQQGLPTWEQIVQRIHPQDLHMYKEAAERAILKKEYFDLEYRIVLPDATVKHLHSLAHSVLSPAGEVLELVGTSVDITERKRAEEALRAQAALLDLTHDTVFVMDMEGVIKYWNRGAEERYGWTAEHALGTVVHDLLKTVFPGPLEEIRAEVSRTGRWEGEILHTKKDGTQVVVASRWALQRDERGAPMAILETNIDITLRKRAEGALRLSNAYNRSLVEASLDPLVTIGPDGKITDVNAATEAATGRSRGELVGTDFCDYFTEPAKARAGYEQVFREGMVRDYPLELRHRDGGVMSVLYNASVYRDEAGRVTGVFAAARDITLRKRAEEALRLSNAYNRSLIEASPDPLVTIGPDGKITDVNAATEAATGRSRGELVGTDFCDYFTEPAKARAGYEQVFREGVVRDYPLELRHRDGDVMSVLYNASVYRDESGRVTGVFAAARDITKRKRAEEALRQSEAYLAESQRLTQTGSWAWDLASDQYVYVSEECLRIFGFDLQQGVPTGEALLRQIHPEDRNRWKENFEKSLHEKVDTSDEYRIVLPDRTVKHIHTIRHPVLNGAGDVVKLVGTSMDITERKRAEEALRQSEAYLAESQRLTHTGSWAFDLASSKYIYASEECFRLFELDAQERFPNREVISRLIHPEDWDRVNESFEKSLREKVDTSSEFRIVLPSGTVKHLQVIRHPVLNDAGDIVELVGTVIDMTERKRAEEALRESETLFRTFVDHAADALFVYDFGQGTIVDVNRQACESLGYTRQELIGTTAVAFHLDSDRAQIESVAQRAAAGETVIDTHWHQRKDGTQFPVEAHTSQYWYGGRRFLLKVARDISDRLRAEEQRERLRQLEADLAHINRVSMMGELTASIAHEVNQPLSGVVSNGSACLRWLAGDVPNVEEAREAARRIVRDGKRAGEVIARVRALAKRTATTNEKLDLNETIREVLALVGDEAKKQGVIIQMQLADDLSPVSGDRVQLQQVMLNLVMNAIEAMSSVEERPRELLITTRNLDADQVQITVKDSGPGIEAQMIDKVFDPFYTTKPHGMGMGLSICRSILQAHGGRLWVATKDGPGTIFHFNLPKYQEEESNGAV